MSNTWRKGEKDQVKNELEDFDSHDQLTKINNEEKEYFVQNAKQKIQPYKNQSQELRNQPFIDLEEYLHYLEEINRNKNLCNNQERNDTILKSDRKNVYNQNPEIEMKREPKDMQFKINKKQIENQKSIFKDLTKYQQPQKKLYIIQNERHEDFKQLRDSQQIQNENVFSLIKVDDTNPTQSSIVQNSPLKQENQSVIKQTINTYEKFLSEESYFKQKNFLAQGGEGTVYDGYYMHENNQKQEVVIKILEKTTIQQFLQEIKIMKLLENNPNIVQLIDSINSQNLYAHILEKCKCNLHDKLTNDLNKEFSFSQLVQIILELLDGLIQLRIYNVLHLDIKPQNILVTYLGNYVYSDFGLSIHLKKQNDKIDCKGFSIFYAPEEQIKNTKDIGFKSDVYALGKTFQQIIKIFKLTNGNNFEQQLISKFEDIINNSMTLKQISQIPERKECQILHQLFFEEIPKNIEYFSKYQKDLNNITNSNEYNDNRNMPYYQEIKLYYLKVQEQLNCYIFKNQIEEDKICFQLGLQYYLLGDYSQAINYVNKSLEFKNFLPENHIEIAPNLSIIGNCYGEQKDFQKALEYQLQSHKILLLTNNYEYKQIEISNSLNSIKRHFEGLEDFENAFLYLKTYIQLFYYVLIEDNQFYQINQEQQGYSKEIYLEYSQTQLQMMQLYSKRDHSRIADLLEDIGDLYSRDQDSQNAINFYNQSLDIQITIYKNTHPKMQNLIQKINLLAQGNILFEVSDQKLKNIEIEIEEMDEEQILFQHLININLLKPSLQKFDINFVSFSYMKIYHFFK